MPGVSGKRRTSKILAPSSGDVSSSITQLLQQQQPQSHKQPPEPIQVTVVHATKSAAADDADPSSVAGRRRKSEEENVILKLTVSGGGAPYDAYDKLGVDSVFESRPCELADGANANVNASVSASASSNASVNASASVPVQAPPPAPQAIPGPDVHAHHKVVRLLAEFEEKSKNGDWPLSTSVHCYWCCHRFDTTPLGLPIKFVGGRFHVVGCFCSLECAAAYNFSAARESVDECLNRYSMINALSVRMGHSRVVRPAPDRLALAIFGGHMGIDEFRAHATQVLTSTPGGERPQRQVVVNCPPMQSVTQQVEEVSDADLSSEYRYIPIDTERVNRYQEKVRLMRTKPLVNFKNTLDHSMKLKYSKAAAE